MIAPSRSAGYRRFYLYSALSMAVVASAVAATLVLRIVLLALSGMRVSADETSRNVSLAVALLAIALPVGTVHLWLIIRSFADPAERAAGVRHQYLNLWLLGALLIVLFAGQAAIGQNGEDATIQLSVLVVAAVVGAIAAWWILRTPPASTAPRIRTGVVVMLVAMAVAAASVANAASGAGGMFQNAAQPMPPYDPSFRIYGGPPRYYQEQAFRSGVLTAGLALLVWSFGFTWQRRWCATRDRLGYALIAYGIGTVVLLVGAAYEIAGAARYASDPSRIGAFTGVWSAVAAGALLVSVQGTLLLLDRGRNGHPGVTTDRLLLAFPALVGLGMVVGGLGVGWHALLMREAVTVVVFADDLSQSVALLLVGVAAYVPAWQAFRARTGAESAVRRFYLFTVVCLALAACLISAVVSVYNAITAIVRVGDPDAPLTALTAILPAVLLGAVFATHLTMLLRDQRQTRATEGVAVEPLLALLEDVRAGRVSVETAAAQLRVPGA